MEGVIKHTVVELGSHTEDLIVVDIGTYKLSFYPEYIKTIAEELAYENGATTIVHLQPGDGTKYLFYLIPQTQDLKITDRFGPSENPWAQEGMVWLAPINLSTTGGMMVTMSWDSNIMYDLEGYSNPHTKKVITLFLDLLWKELKGVDLISLTCFTPSEDDEQS